MMKVILPLFFIGVFADSTSLQNTTLSYGENCVTPKGEEGSCLNLIHCKSLHSLLSTARANVVDRDFLRASKCGGTLRNILCCCPKAETREFLDKHEALLPSREACGRQTLSKEVLGNKTDVFEFPWTVQLWYMSRETVRDTNLCLGVLINEDHVVTAAQCVNEQVLNEGKYTLLAARLGEWNASSTVDCNEDNICADPVVDVPIAQTFSHENFNPESNSSDFDIAVIRLVKKVNFTKSIQPICLPLSDNQKRPINKNALSITSWLDEKNATANNIKLKASVQLVDHEACAKAHPLLVDVKDHHVCTNSVGSDESGECFAKAGVPLMDTDKTDPARKIWYLSGVHSFGPEHCGSTDIPAVYTRIHNHIDWILSKIK